MAEKMEGCFSFGMMGEQGLESIHAYFNSLSRTYMYQNIPNKVERLRAMMREHLLHSEPGLVEAQPAIKRRKKATVNEE